MFLFLCNGIFTTSRCQLAEPPATSRNFRPSPAGRGPASQIAGSSGSEASRGSRTPSAIKSSRLLGRLRASHLKIPSPPLSERPPEGTPKSRARHPPLHALPFRAPSPSRPPRSVRSSQPLKYPGLRAIPFKGTTAWTRPSHRRGSSKPWSPPRSSLPLRSPAAAHLSVTRPFQRGETLCILGVVVHVPLTCRSQGGRERQNKRHFPGFLAVRPLVHTRPRFAAPRVARSRENAAW